MCVSVLLCVCVSISVGLCVCVHLYRVTGVPQHSTGDQRATCEELFISVHLVFRQGLIFFCIALCAPGLLTKLFLGNSPVSSSHFSVDMLR